MNILITGGAGFIGSHLAEHLLARHDRVVLLDNLNDYYDPKIKQANLAEVLKNKDVTFVKGDILDEALLDSLFRTNSFDVVVHLAALVGVRPSLRQPILYERVNCRGTLHVLECMRRHGVRRLVFASSSSVYGNVRRLPFREDERIDTPVSPYAATKAAGELYCYNYHHLHGISVTALRFFTAYGPRQRPDMAIHKFTALIEARKPVPFYGDGSTARDYTYCTDIIAGVSAAVDRDLGFQIINLGEARTTTLAELVALLEKHLGKKATLERLPPQPGDMPNTWADVSKAKALLEYSPSVPIEEGIERFVKWYRTRTW